MVKFITVIIKRAGQSPCLKKIEPTLENFIEIVDGPLSVIDINDGMLKMYFNKEGKKSGKPINFVMGESPNMLTIVGDVVFFRQNEAIQDSVCANDVKLITTMINWQITTERPTSAFIN